MRQIVQQVECWLSPHSRRPTCYTIMQTTMRLLIAPILVLGFSGACTDDASTLDSPGSDVAPGTDTAADTATDTATDTAADTATDTAADTATDTAAPTSSLSWNTDIGPMLQANCGGCHHDGGSGQFDLMTYDTAARFAPSALAAMQAGRMPPWPPAAGCRDYVGERVMAPDDLATFAAWVDAGMPAGDGEPIVFAPPEVVALRPDISTSMLGTYTPEETLSDDYRCFILDREFAEDTWVEGVDVQPGTAQVHHVLVYAVPEEQLEVVVAADEDEAGPGYTCFGGPFPPNGRTGGMLGGGANLPVQVGAWVPGVEARPLPTGAALLIESGSRLVMQIHYNLLANEPQPDLTSLTLQTRDTPPDFTWRTVPVAQRNLNIPAGEANSVQSITIRHSGRRPATIASATHHMHTLGREIRGYITRADGSEECLLDIPNWDFQWQMNYQFPDDSFAVLQPGDSVTLECVYDNSQANQPMVGGVQQEPRDVEWGEGTLDEMCLMYLGLISPYSEPEEPTDASACAAAAECYEVCDPASATCLLNCEGADTGCLVCAAQKLIGCGAAVCASELTAARACLTDCVIESNAFEGPLGACMRDTCPETWAATTGCLDPFVERETCQLALQECGL